MLYTQQNNALYSSFSEYDRVMMDLGSLESTHGTRVALDRCVKQLIRLF